MAVFITVVCAEDFFSMCRFHFGTDITKAQNNSEMMKEVDYLTGPWMGSAETFNIGSFFTTCKNNNKTPVTVAYIIAFAAKRDLKIEDCNVHPTENLCKKGADYIRQNRSKILNIYDNFAKGIAGTYGTSKPVIFCMEPDYSQYTESTQNGGGITYQQAGTLMNDIIGTIKKSLPKAMFSMDISPWKDTTWQVNWYNALNISSNFSFINTSGGQSKAATDFISDSWSPSLPKWAWVLKRWGKPVIADAGYGVNGSGTGHDNNWDNVNNLKARIADGVIGVSQYNAKNDWYTTIRSIRNQLPTPPKCPAVSSIQKERFPQYGNISIHSGEMVQIINLSGKIIASLPEDTDFNSSHLGKITGKGMFLIRNSNGKIIKKLHFY